MKIAIITFHAPTNYGAFLQAYALQTYLNDKLNIETDILNYQTKLQKQLCSIFLPMDSMQNLVKNGTALLHYRRLKLREQEFNEMKKSFLKLTKPLDSIDDVKSIYNEYDLLISGSDQIWNGEIRGFANGGQEPYFLKDCTKRKIAYGTSLGPKDTPVVRATIEHNIDSISTYAKISVREVFAQKLLQDYIDQTIEPVVDPVFLLDRGDYKELFNHRRTPKQEYLLLYTINFDSGLLKKTAEIARELHLPVIVPFTNHKAIFCKKYGFQVLYDVGPGCFLDLLDQATLVITDSFHGTAFSIHFAKEFFCYQAVNSGVPVKDDRLETLLETSGFSHRIISERDDFKVCHTPIGSVNPDLKKKIEESKHWLQDAIVP